MSDWPFSLMPLDFQNGALDVPGDFVEESRRWPVSLTLIELQGDGVEVGNKLVGVDLPGNGHGD